MAAEIDATYKADPRKTHYTAPANHVAALVQMPSYLIDGYSLADAYMRDFQDARRKERANA